MILSARGLSKHYGKLEVLKGVSLAINKGEFVAIAGPSGAGKSTLLHLLGGLDIPDEGDVFIMKEALFQLSPREQYLFRNKNIGFVFQFHHLLPEFTALENVAMPLWIGGVREKKARSAAADILTTVGLKERLNHKPTELSGGEQQRVAIARAIVTRPSIIFADEPTGNLDTQNAHSIHELFLRLREQFQLTFIIVTHNEQLANMADKVFLMKDGKITKEQMKPESPLPDDME